jgi:acetoacetate decarboxylase
MYLDSEAGIASGRELLGFPKVLAQPKFEVRNDALVGTLDYNGVRVATATMAYKYNTLDLEAVKRRSWQPVTC